VYAGSCIDSHSETSMTSHSHSHITTTETSSNSLLARLQTYTLYVYK